MQTSWLAGWEMSGQEEGPADTALALSQGHNRAPLAAVVCSRLASCTGSGGARGKQSAASRGCQPCIFKQRNRQGLAACCPKAASPMMRPS